MPVDGVIRYFIADAEAGSRVKPGDTQLVLWAIEEWERNAGGLLRFTRSNTDRGALLHFHWLSFHEDGALGRTAPSDEGGHTGMSISITPDEGHFRPGVRRRVLDDPLMRDVVLYFVCLHEIGHALGLTHSDNPRDIMWPGNAGGVTLPVYDRHRHRLQSRDGIPGTPWLSSDDIARLKAVWERQPLAQ